MWSIKNVEIVNIFNDIQSLNFFYRIANVFSLQISLWKTWFQAMSSGKEPHILNASSNLMGICFVLVTALKLTKAGLATFADETSLIASVLFMASCVLSYLSMRSVRKSGLFERWADYLFLAGSLSLFTAIVLFATGTL